MSMRLITRLCQQALIAAAEAALPLRVVVEPAAIGPPLLRGCCDRRAHRASQAHRQQQRRDDAPHGPVGLFRSCATARRAHRQAAFVIIDPCPARPDRFGVLPALCGGERLFGVKQPALDFPLGQWLGHFGCSVWRDLGARSADEPQRHLAVAQGDELAGEGVAQWPDRQMRVLPQYLGLELQLGQRRRGDSDIALDPALLDRLGAKAPLPGSVAADGLEDG